MDIGLVNALQHMYEGKNASSLTPVVLQSPR